MTTSITSELPRDERLGRRELFPYWSKESVRWSDTDRVGHVNNVAYAVYCESGRTAFLTPLTLGKPGVRTLLLLAQINLSFRGESDWPAIVDIGTVVLDIGQSSCRIGHGLYVGERCVATADSLLVHIDETTRRPRELPDSARAYLSRHGLVAA
jgi:acyl-CoA thioester hydrolase